MTMIAPVRQKGDFLKEILATSSSVGGPEKETIPEVCR